MIEIVGMRKKQEFDPVTSLLHRTDRYTWNPVGRLTAIDVQQSGQLCQSIRNQCEAGQIRKRRIGSDGARTDYYHSGLPVLSEDRNSAVERTVSVLVGHQALGYNAGRAWHWFIADALGSIREFVDGHGNWLGCRVYDEYGGLSSMEGLPHVLFGFSGVHGVHFDADLVCNNLRWYSPATGRFLRGAGLVLMTLRQWVQCT